MEIKFIKISPTQNMTILVESLVPRESHHLVASKLLAYDHVYGEQVGFIEAPTNPEAWSRLQMMGGEFCGNATMSLAVVEVWKKALPVGTKIEVPLESSGAEGIVTCGVEVRDEGYYGSVAIEAPKKIETTELMLDGKAVNCGVVYLNGITHVIVDKTYLQESKESFGENVVAQWGKIFTDDAFGVMLHDPSDNSIVPFVYVKPTNSSVWERGCGSGSAALGSYLAYSTGRSLKVDIPQPGGVITVNAEYDGEKVVKTTITGKVNIVATGTAYTY